LGGNWKKGGGQSEGRAKKANRLAYERLKNKGGRKTPIGKQHWGTTGGKKCCRVEESTYKKGGRLTTDRRKG